MKPTEFLLKELERLEKLERAATAAPWEMARASSFSEGKVNCVECFVRRPGDDVSICADVIDPNSDKPSGETAAFIAETRNALPGLLKSLRALVVHTSDMIEIENFLSTNSVKSVIQEEAENVLAEAAKALGFNPEDEGKGGET